jgi:hypothetical protein
MYNAKLDDFEYLSYLTITILVAFGLLWSFEDDWKKRLNIKNEINDINELKYDFEYIPDFYYTDSLIKYCLYWVAKLAIYMINLSVVLLIWYLILNWFWSVSIAPTTIIIILLIIIIFNQSKKD